MNAEEVFNNLKQKHTKISNEEKTYQFLTKQASHSSKWLKALTPQEKSYQSDSPLSLPSRKLRQLNHQLLYILQRYLCHQCNWTVKHLNIACKCFYHHRHQLLLYQNIKLAPTVKKHNCVSRCQIAEWCKGCITAKKVQTSSGNPRCNSNTYQQ